jgi:hypothetical protein
MFNIFNITYFLFHISFIIKKNKFIHILLLLFYIILFLLLADTFDFRVLHCEDRNSIHPVSCYTFIKQYFYNLFNFSSELPPQPGLQIKDPIMTNPSSLLSDVVNMERNKRNIGPIQ